MKYIHPFPARMAPELASEKLSSLTVGSKILDPMCGSGTTLRYAIDNGHNPEGWDIDPLAVKMSRTWCRRFNFNKLAKDAAMLKRKLQGQNCNPSSRFFNCQETQKFVNFWFAKNQENDLNRLSLMIEEMFPPGRTRDFFQIAMSRIIITKFRGASLAWDISHSRPHKKKQVNDFEIMPEFFKSVQKLIVFLEKNPIKRDARVKLGDCKNISTDEKFDAIITSPPYLNAIDYIRGHKFSLVWMGYTIPELRKIRGDSIGSERGLPELIENKCYQNISKDACKGLALSPRVKKYLFRYISDCENLVGSMCQLLKPSGSLIVVVADSNQRGTQISNSEIICNLANRAGLKTAEKKRRVIAAGSRYLPISNAGNQISKRMKIESVLQFVIA